MCKILQSGHANFLMDRMVIEVSSIWSLCADHKLSRKPGFLTPLKQVHHSCYREFFFYRSVGLLPLPYKSLAQKRDRNPKVYVNTDTNTVASAEFCVTCNKSAGLFDGSVIVHRHVIKEMELGMGVVISLRSVWLASWHRLDFIHQVLK